MRVNLVNVLSQEGRTEQLDVELTMESFDSGLEQFAIAASTPIHLQLTHTRKQVLQIAAAGEVSVWIPCGRCLEPVKVEFPLCAEREVDMKKTEEERAEELDEISYIQDKELDVDQLVHNEILIHWPMRVLCKEDCKGICSHCGTNLNRETCNCDTTEADPSMAVIRDIFSKFKEV